MTDPVARPDHARPPDEPSVSRPFLKVRPQRFFSNRFEFDVVDEEHDVERRRPPSGLRRVVDVDLIIMILIIGVPLLLYCVFAALR